MKALNSVGNPYIDVRDLEPDFSFNTEIFGFAFRKLFDEGLINSRHPYGGCGWSDGQPSWSIIEDLHVTSLGLVLLNPPKIKFTKRLSDFFKHPLVVGLFLAVATIYITKVYSDSTKQYNQSKSQVVEETTNNLEIPKQPPTSKEIPLKEGNKVKDKHSLLN